MVELLPYQDSRTLPMDNNDHGSTEILDITTTIESKTHSATRHSREVFMAGQPPQIPMPNPPYIQDGEEALSDVAEPPNLMPPKSVRLLLDTKHLRENTKLLSFVGHTPGENPKIHIFAIRITNERIKHTLFLTISYITFNIAS